MHIEREGVTVNAMGLDVPNQPITLPNPEYADPDGLDTEGVVTQANRASRRLWLGLKYHDSMPVLSKLKLISKPTKRIWLSHADFSKVIRGQEAGEVKGLRQIGEIMVVSTDKGIMEARECVDRRIGGQPLMRVW
jgi:ribosomal protein S8